MRLPAPSSAYTTFVRYGFYVVRRLRRAGYADLAASAEKATLAVRVSGRAWEDADDAIQAALADRDAIDDDLDDAAQSARNTLAGRATAAVREEPYILIFPDGIGYYIAAPLDENAGRFGEFAERLKAHLPAGDEVRKATVPVIVKGIKAFDEASKALDGAESAERLAGTRARSAVRAFQRQIEKTYGALLIEVGRSAAERFFPRARAAKAAATPADPATEPVKP
jgi:hypothetical protein